ncbi:non-specific serine,threonine protein kinase, partial [Sarracenia purpurea var. burkii]
MEEIFGEILGCGFGSDSIMLKLLRSAMDKAHENVQSTNGSIELLNARSKFYELAMILVEGCSKLIEEKPEVPEIDREKMLKDLMESRDMVRGRLEELELGIVGKDREFTERSENECRLWQTLELKEMELVSLRAKIEFEKTEEEFLSDPLIGDEGKEGDICELKNSVDQQVWSIKQKLENERISLTGGSENFEMEPANHFSRPEQNLIIEQMSSDIDGLKGTLDLAFVRMQSAEMRPLEKQWRWKIEKDIILIFFKDFMSNLTQKLESEVEKRAKRVPRGFLNERWPELIDKITDLHRELEALFSSNEVDVRKVEGFDSSGPSTRMQRSTSEPLPEVSYKEEPREQEEDGDGSHYVSKMIKNHESIIRKQREELNWLKREILREKESLSTRRLKDPNNNLERRIQEVIARLDSFIKWSGKEESRDRERIDVDCSAVLDEKVVNDSVFYGREIELNDEIRKLKQESDDLDLKTKIIEEAYAVLFVGLMNDFHLELHDYEVQCMIKDDVFMCLFREKINKTIESLVEEDIYLVFFREMINEWKMEMDASILENLFREEIYNFIVVETVNDAFVVIEPESLNRENLSKKSDTCLEASGEEGLIQKLDSLLKCIEVEEDMMLKASSEIKEHSANNDLVASECEEVDERDAIEWLLTEEEITFNSVSNKLDKALQQLLMSKALLRELQESLGIIAAGDIEKVLNQINPILDVVHNKELNPSDSMLSHLVGFQQTLADFECTVSELLKLIKKELSVDSHHT